MQLVLQVDERIVARLIKANPAKHGAYDERADEQRFWTDNLKGKSPSFSRRVGLTAPHESDAPLVVWLRQQVRQGGTQAPPARPETRLALEQYPARITVCSETTASTAG